MGRIGDIFSRGNSWTMPASRFVLLLSLINTLLFNGALYSFLAAKLDLYSVSGILIGASVIVGVFVINLFFISALAIVAFVAVKPFFALTALINSVALYYMISYQVVLDKAMMGNIFNTRSSEALELWTPTLLIYILFLAVVPGALITKVRARPLNKLRIALNFFLILALSLLFLYLNSPSWLWVDKYSRLLGGKTLPWSYIINSVRHYSDTLGSDQDQIPLPAGTFADEEKRVVALIIGEAARASNFSLYGYVRNTNPRLQSDDISVFERTTSCSTYTTASIACILSHDVNASGYEPLPSYLTRIGADVIWRTNNWGEPPIVVSKYQTGSELRRNCHGDGCEFDEVLLTQLGHEIESSDKRKIFIVLHAKGSHGPSYYSRYPSGFEKFTPVCRSEDLGKCSAQELINAYDNTIMYTDHFLHRAIQELDKLNIPAMLIYVSDHGESLGENGLYLHGAPLMFAPKYQTEIPFIIWRSQELKKSTGSLGAGGKDGRRPGAFSHANIFHTIIGALGARTDVYKRELDVFSGNSA